MRRYWISIVLCVFIVVGLGTYYVYGAVAQFPEYKISKVSGDVNEGTKIEVTGNFSDGGRYRYLTVTADGSYFPSGSSIYSRIFSDPRSWLNEQADIRQIFKDHRSFMRGKGNPNCLYKDDEWIIYADAVVNNTSNATSEIVLSIDLLNQASGEVKHYETIVDDQTDYSQIYVEDVQLIGEQLHLLINQRSIASQGKRVNGPEQQYHDYVVDINSGALTNNGRLAFSDSTKEDVDLFDRSILNAIYSSPGDYALLIVTERPHRENAYMGITDDQIYSYNYKTGMLTDLSDTLMKAGIDDIGNLSLDGNVINILNYEEDVIKLTRYNIDSGTLANQVISLTAKQLDADKILNGKMKNNKLYILFHKNDIPKVAVLDATSGDILYQGEIIYDGDTLESTRKLLNVESLYIQIAD